jgi:hypothetical protein
MTSKKEMGDGRLQIGGSPAISDLPSPISGPPAPERGGRKITGQVVYMGPHVRHLGLGYAAIFRDGIHPHLYDSIAVCPPLGELFVPVAQCGAVRRELAFDYAHNMRGTRGKYVTFYQAVQSWIAHTQKKTPTPSSGITLEHHNA